MNRVKICYKDERGYLRSETVPENEYPARMDALADAGMKDIWAISAGGPGWLTKKSDLLRPQGREEGER